MTALAREETDRLRGLARAAWARMKRDDLSGDEQEAAQEEHARTRDEILDHGIEVEVTDEQEIIASFGELVDHGARYDDEAHCASGQSAPS